jgi:hypothetical protein
MNTYNIGPLTMEYVFKRAGLTNVSDMQAVFDAVEGALEYKNEVYRDMCREMADRISYIERVSG